MTHFKVETIIYSSYGSTYTCNGRKKEYYFHLHDTILYMVRGSYRFTGSAESKTSTCMTQPYGLGQSYRST